MKGKIGGRLEAKTTMIGHGSNDAQETRILNRIIRATSEGWEIEADQRHAEIMVNMLNMGNAKEVNTPGESRPWEEEKLSEQQLGESWATEYRAISARANYLAQDRPDIQFAVKEICRAMSSPTEWDKRKIKRLVRYLRGFKIYHYRVRNES